ncbi:MAG TPA: sialate O-acetylesterase [Chthoniobacteraceae bacterium]|jgi:sialate O-acetylesterase|nr:sialate O-acetylesterase [Chthoniobacteraceae bacterium]
MTHPLRRTATAAAALILAGSSAALANVKLPAIFGDHMVLQQGMPVPVWGTADPGEPITVTVDGQSAQTKAGDDGKWMVKLKPLKPPGDAVSLTVKGKNTLTIKDVLIGEVWVCSGQSNMEFSLRNTNNAQIDLPAASDPQLRFFVVAHKTAHTPEPDVQGKWVLCSPDSSTNFTAVGYFFGRELRHTLKQPVGLIATYWGGTPAQSWTSLEGLQKEPVLAHYVNDWKKIDADYAQAAIGYPAALAAYGKEMEEWRQMHGAEYNDLIAKWKEASLKAIAAKASPPPRPTPPAPLPKRPIDPSGGEHSAATLYNGMIAPLIPYAIRGTIWYQGESNAGAAEEYRTLFPAMIKDWRAKWGEGNFPFLWVQLAGFHADDTDKWPNLRDAQARTLSLPATGMATAVDIGLPANIHPTDKYDVGKRLSLIALDVAYGRKLVDSGPVFKGVQKDPKGLRVEFQDNGSALKIGKTPWPRQEYMLPMDHLVGFELAGADDKWQPANAVIDGKSVLVSSSTVPDPTQVRYDWKSFPEGNLYNMDNLPATPFKAALAQ